MFGQTKDYKVANVHQEMRKPILVYSILWEVTFRLWLVKTSLLQGTVYYQHLGFPYFILLNYNGILYILYPVVTLVIMVHGLFFK
jgi:hypothetical protein